ncbi:MAG: 7-carboxy-7-deazaguanine synthase QueE [Deltaproteobacteria bacterium]|nr:7-carboxy-7-deazaguanine synthase QueE [Deltaproteobacteria bacterium]
MEANIIEIFSSFQGEGTHAGEQHLFVRFQDCELCCKWCDTPATFVENRFCRVEFPPFSKKIKLYPNPVSVSALNEILTDFSEETIAITGGEPLQKVSFLKEWLPTLEGKRVLLETAGVHGPELSELLPWVSIVSMDIKLSSSTGMHPWWREHEDFLRRALKKEVYIKVVVTQETEDRHVERAAALVASINPKIPFILQPASITAKFRAVPSAEQISRWLKIVRAQCPAARILPQIHKQLGVN